MGREHVSNPLEMREVAGDWDAQEPHWDKWINTGASQPDGPVTPLG